MKDRNGESPPELTDAEETVAFQPRSEPAGEEPTPDPLSAPGAQRYQARGEIGRGGMGAVRRVLDPSLRRVIALKELSPGDGDSDDRVRRFLVEARITGQLDHPNIVPVYELGRDEQGVYFFTMKLIDGVSLARQIAAAGSDRLRPDRLTEFLEILLKVCDAVAFAHSRGVIHRDIKPSNIMVGEFGEVFLTDWGIARPLGSGSRVSTGWDGVETEPPGTLAGSPAFMAPEQARADPSILDERTDIFALGATLYTVLTARPPYRDPVTRNLLARVSRGDFPAPSEVVGEGRIPPRLEAIALRAMAREPEDRFPSVAELRHEIQSFLRGGWSFPVRTFVPGEPIVTEGEAAHSAFVICSGRCRVIKEAEDGSRPVLRELAAGDVFGETAIFSERLRTATVEAIGEVQVLEIDREALSSGLGLDSWMGRFVRSLADRFLETEARLRALEDAPPAGG